MGFGANMGGTNTGGQSVLFLSLAEYHHRTGACIPTVILCFTTQFASCTSARRAITVISRWSSDGSSATSIPNIWPSTQPWTILDKGACRGDYHGGGRGHVCVCRTCHLISHADLDSAGIKTDIIAVQRFHYHQTFNFGYQFIIVMSTQLIGFSIGGIAKRFLVSPPSMSESDLGI